MIETGNAIAEGESRRGWFIGNFIQPEQPLKTNNEIEVKWGIHPKGERRESLAVEGDILTISLLIRGHFKVIFSGHEEVLKREGDYVMWKPNVRHSSEAIEDSVIVTIRMPSIPQIK